jgi:hypothetical protein
LEPKNVDSNADREQVIDKPASKALDAESRLEGKGKTGEGDRV